MKYQSLITYQSKNMTNVNFFADRKTDKQTEGQANIYMSLIFQYGEIKIHVVLFPASQPSMNFTP
jgi:hypothetical protein